MRSLRDRGFDVEHCTAAGYDELRRATRIALSEPARALIVVGGDGMAHLAVGLLAEVDVPLGIVPTGTGNDLARGLGLPIGDVGASVTRIVAALAGEPRRIDAVRILGADGVERDRFVCVFSAGFDAVVNERANRLRRPRGASRYILALLLELALLRPRRYRLVIDGVAEEGNALLAAVANNRSLGGGMMIAPDARLDDGLLDLVLVRPLGRFAFLRVFPRVFRGTHVTLPVVRIQRCRTVEIHADDVIAYADGERIGPLPLRLDVLPGALRVLA